MENVYSFTAAVRGFHYYRKFWKPIENERLSCFHEDGNPYDRFAIKTATSNGATVGHLPKEISRVTKFFLDRGASMQVELTSKHYRRSPLVQGGMEIPCLVTVKTPATLKNTELADKYLELVKERYTEPKNEEILGSFVNEIDEEDPLQKTGKRRMRKNTPPPPTTTTTKPINTTGYQKDVFKPGMFNQSTLEKESQT